MSGEFPRGWLPPQAAGACRLSGCLRVGGWGNANVDVSGREEFNQAQSAASCPRLERGGGAKATRPQGMAPARADSWAAGVSAVSTANTLVRAMATVLPLLPWRGGEDLATAKIFPQLGHEHWRYGAGTVSRAGYPVPKWKEKCVLGLEGGGNRRSTTRHEEHSLILVACLGCAGERHCWRFTAPCQVYARAPKGGVTIGARGGITG